MSDDGREETPFHADRETKTSLHEIVRNKDGILKVSDWFRRKTEQSDARLEFARRWAVYFGLAATSAGLVTVLYNWGAFIAAALDGGKNP